MKNEKSEQLFEEAKKGQKIRGELDYSDGQLKAEPGLMCDIHHVSSLVAKLSLSLLSGGTKRQKNSLACFANGAKKNNYIVMSNTNNFWIFPEVLGEENANDIQYSHTTWWISTKKKDQ